MEDKDLIMELQKKEDAFRQIGEFTDGLSSVLSTILKDTPEAPIVDMTLKKIANIVKNNIRG